MTLDKNILQAAYGAYNDVLRMLLAVARPYDSAGDVASRVWLKDYLDRLIRDTGGCYRLEEDAKGNLFVHHVDKPTVLFTCHTDTAHRETQGHACIKDGDTYRLMPGSRSSCLGADDAVGVALCAGMMTYGMGADFAFYVGEERGAVGSSWSATYDTARYTHYEAAISLDRRGTTSVITHQGERTASDEFARSLARALNMTGYVQDYAADPTGIFTDSKILADIIPECTNLSVGYYNEHTQRETLDDKHARRLLAALLAMDMTELVIDREPGVGDWDDYDLSYDWEEWASADTIAYMDEHGVLREYDPIRDGAYMLPEEDDNDR